MVKENIEEVLKLIEKAKEVCKEANKTYEFECPICGGQARAAKASINCHIHIRCDKCDTTIMQ